MYAMSFVLFGCWLRAIRASCTHQHSHTRRRRIPEIRESDSLFIYIVSRRAESLLRWINSVLLTRPTFRKPPFVRSFLFYVQTNTAWATTATIRTKSKISHRRCAGVAGHGADVRTRTRRQPLRPDRERRAKETAVHRTHAAGPPRVHAPHAQHVLRQR